MSSVRKIVLVVHVILVKPNIMQKLDGINIMIHEKPRFTDTPSKQHRLLLYMDCHSNCTKKS